jgi:hypothetical protein
MSRINERWLEQRRSRWLRPDYERFLRPDRARYESPGATQQNAAPNSRWLPLAHVEREQKAFREDQLSLAELRRERLWLMRQKLVLLELYDLRLRLKAQLYNEKYSPNQPRVPKGNPDGGQWTSYGGGSGGGGRVQVADLRSGRGRINDRSVISDADPDRPLNGPTAARYRDPNNPNDLGRFDWRNFGGGGGRSGSGGSPSRGAGASKAAIEALAKENPLFKAGLNQYRNSDLTQAGRALTKHPRVIGATKDTLRKTLRSDASINDAAHSALADIVRNGVTTTRTHKGYGPIIQTQIPGGFGARWYADGRFIGFISP